MFVCYVFVFSVLKLLYIKIVIIAYKMTDASDPKIPPYKSFFSNITSKYFSFIYEIMQDIKNPIITPIQPNGDKTAVNHAHTTKCKHESPYFSTIRCVNFILIIKAFI